MRKSDYLVALDYLVRHETTPSQCCDCPFSREDISEGRSNPSDPGEGHYRCLILGDDEVSKRNNTQKCWTYGRKTVWGETPLCNRKDWESLAIRLLPEEDLKKKLIRSMASYLADQGFRTVALTDMEDEIELQLLDASWVTIGVTIAPVNSNDLNHRWSC